MLKGAIHTAYALILTLLSPVSVFAEHGSMSVPSMPSSSSVISIGRAEPSAAAGSQASAAASTAKSGSRNSAFTSVMEMIDSSVESPEENPEPFLDGLKLAITRDDTKGMKKAINTLYCPAKFVKNGVCPSWTVQARNLKAAKDLIRTRLGLSLGDLKVQHFLDLYRNAGWYRRDAGWRGYPNP